MYVRWNESGGTVLAPAKLNLFLEVLDQQPDGFHAVQSFMVPIRLFDTLRLRALPAGSGGSPGPVRLSVRSAFRRSLLSGPIPEIPSDEGNLVVRALRLLQSRSGCSQGATAQLVKRIPPEAGLGGGSSDAAAALVLANHAWKLGYARQQLAELAGKVGSDVPFFLHDSAAVCTGRGERVERCQDAPTMHFVVAKPPVGLKTASIYDALRRQRSNASTESPISVEGLVVSLSRGLFDRVGGQLRNRLQEAAAAISPWITRLRNAFGRLDFLGHQMTGSGSAYFGLCRSAWHARRLASVLDSQRLGIVYSVSSCH